MAERKPAEKRKGNTSPLHILNVNVRTLNRQTQDIGRWRTALRSADNGRRSLLYNLYEDILLDGLLSDAIDKRIRAITNADITFTVNDSEVDEINTLMRTRAWRDMLHEMMLAQFWGLTLLELDYTKLFEAHSWPRKNINPKKKLALLNENDEEGIEYADDPFFLEIEQHATNGLKSFGLILKACPYVIYKRGNFGDWAQFAELFGMPFRTGKYNSYDEQGRLQLEQALSEAGSAAYAVIPKDSDIEFMSNNSTGDGGLYDKLRKACNEEILYGILGQSMTTVQGDKGARSLGEVHLEVQEGIHADDRLFVASILNEELLPRMEARGFKVSGGVFKFPEIGETLSLQDRIKIDQRLDQIVDIDADYFYDTYGIPKPKNGGGKKQPPEPPQPPQPPKGKKSDKTTMADEQTSFWEGFFNFFVNAPQDGATNGNHHTNNNDGTAITCCGHDKNLELADFPQFDENSLLDRIAKNQPFFDVPLFEWTKDTLLGAFRSGWDAKRVELVDLGFDYGFTDEVAQTMMETNLFHFSAAKTMAECQELNRLFRAAPNFSQFKTDASAVVGNFNDLWMRTEYDTAYLTAESSATYYRLLKQTDLFPYWEYKTANDNRVRYEHALLDGLILPANDPRWKKIMPPNGWNCRCYIVPRTRAEVEGVNFAEQRKKADNYMNGISFKKEAAQGWGVNRAELKQVFTADQFYMRKFPGRSSKQLDKLTWKDYGLNSVSTAMKKALNPVLKYTGTADNWKNGAEKIVGDIILKDYNNRNLVLTESNFKAHTTGKRADRVNYLDAMKETLKAPDEVWIAGKQLSDYYLVKYYNDQVFITICKVEGGKVYYIKDFYPLELTKAEIDKHRSGLLIKHNS